MTVRKRQTETQKLREALVRAVQRHGHDYTCSASRGLDSECHCGWVKIKQMVKEIEGKRG